MNEATMEQRSQWHEHLREATGPLAFDAIEHLQPEPELLELLRDLAQPPWPEEPERVIDYSTPLLAAMLLGLIGDKESVPDIIEGLREAHHVHWDWYIEEAPTILSLMGPEALPSLVEELQRIEGEPERDPNPPYHYWSLVMTLGHMARLYPSTVPVVAGIAAERIRDRRHDSEHTQGNRKEREWFQDPTPQEIWVDENLDMQIPELWPVIEEFFERLGPEYDNDLFGNRDDYYKLLEIERRPVPSREELIASYRDLHVGTTTPEPEPPKKQNRKETFGARDYTPYSYDRSISAEPYIRTEPKIGRNDPCPCGSGKKYKKCCGR